MKPAPAQPHGNLLFAAKVFTAKRLSRGIDYFDLAESVVRL